MNAVKILIILTFFSLGSFVYSQQKPGGKSSASSKPTYIKMTIRTAPKLTFEFSGSYNYGVYELSANDNGDFSSAEFINGENFGVRHGFGGSMAIKIPLHKKGNIRLDISGGYNAFSSKFNEYLKDNQEGGFASYNMLMGGVGLENNFTPNHRFKTLVGAGLVGSYILGNAKVFDKNENEWINLKIYPAFRLGVSIFSGLEYLIDDNFGINCGFKFTHANLWLKNSKASDNPNEVYLNDKRMVPRIPYSGWRQFAWGSFYGGVNVYFGVKQKYYIIKKF